MDTDVWMVPFVIPMFSIFHGTDTDVWMATINCTKRMRGWYWPGWDVGPLLDNPQSKQVLILSWDESQGLSQLGHHVSLQRIYLEINWQCFRVTNPLHQKNRGSNPFIYDDPLLTSKPREDYHQHHRSNWPYHLWLNRQTQWRKLLSEYNFIGLFASKFHQLWRLLFQREEFSHGYLCIL